MMQPSSKAAASSSSKSGRGAKKKPAPETPKTKGLPKSAQAPSRKEMPKLSVVTAKDYVPGKENEVLEGVQKLLVSSTKLVNRTYANAKNQTSGWLWDSSSNQEEKKSEDQDAKRSGNSEDWTPNEMDGLMDSMTYVLQAMETYRARVSKAATDFMQEQNLAKKAEQNLAKKTDQADKEGGIWDLGEAAKDMSTADFLLGSLMPNQSGDVYPEGSQPIFNRSTFLGPTTDMFLNSFSSLLGTKPGEAGGQLHNGNLLMESQLRYLEDVQSVKSVCKSQINELDAILSNQGIYLDTVEEVESVAETVPEPEIVVEPERLQELDTEVSKPGMAEAYELRHTTSLATQNSVVTRDVEDKTHPPLNKTAMSYIQAARNKLEEYSKLADDIFKDKVKCMVSEYSCVPDGEAASGSESRESLYFEPLRKHFNSNVYNMDFESYLTEEQDHKMQAMLLDLLHSSLFLRNVGDKCQDPIRLHVGRELSVSICNVVMASLLNSKMDHRMTEWGACLFARHVRALHAYAFEFCRSTEGTETLLAKVEKSSLEAEPMDPNWERLFSALELLKLERLEDYNDEMLHPLCTLEDAQRILRLRTEFSDHAINTRVVLQTQVDERNLG